MPGAKKQNRWIIFRTMWRPNHRRIYLLQTWSMFEFIQVRVDCKHGWRGFDRTPKATVFFNQLDVIKTSQNHSVPQTQAGFWVATICKTWTPEAARHRCIWRHSKATILWSRGSSKPRRLWMHRTNTALALDEDLRGNLMTIVMRMWMKMLMVLLGRGSWGGGPLHLAAGQGRDSVVQQLLEAKADVDATDKDSRGLGGGFGMVVRKWIECWWFKCFVDIVFTFDVTLGDPSMYSAPRRNLFYWRFSLGSFLERPLQSKIDHKFPAPFNGPWHSPTR